MTIAAIATGPGAGGIGVIRISGPRALTAARRVVPGLPAQPTPRVATFARFTDGRGAVLDEGLVLYFAGPKSFTGEDVVELQAHGAPRLLSLLLGEIVQVEGVRLATPGEFTRRAFLSGRLQLSQAEAVADLIAAESEAQVRAAAAQLAGGLEVRLEALHAPLLALQADLEGVLDFPEEAEGAEADAARRLVELEANARSLVGDVRRGVLVRRGAKVVLFGPVNAGKSTLFNALIGTSRALVDDEPGTTRDTLEARLELGGLAVTLVDTAGLREGAGRIEAMGIERTREAVTSADLAVLVLPPGASEAERATWSAEAKGVPLLVLEGKADQHVSPAPPARGAQHLAPSHPAGERGDASPHTGAALDVSGPDRHDSLSPGTTSALDVSGADQQPSRSAAAGKTTSDARPANGPPPLPEPLPREATGRKVVGARGEEEGELRVSGLTGLGVEPLRAEFVSRLGGSASVLGSSERHHRALERVLEHLTLARAAATVSTLEVVAGELALALDTLAELRGADASSELLDALFARFCIGK